MRARLPQRNPSVGDNSTGLGIRGIVAVRLPADCRALGSLAGRPAGLEGYDSLSSEIRVSRALASPLSRLAGVAARGRAPAVGSARSRKREQCERTGLSGGLDHIRSTRAFASRRGRGSDARRVGHALRDAFATRGRDIGHHSAPASLSRHSRTSLRDTVSGDRRPVRPLPVRPIGRRAIQTPAGSRAPPSSHSQISHSQISQIRRSQASLGRRHQRSNRPRD